MSVTYTSQIAQGADRRQYNVANPAGATGATVSVPVAVQDNVLPASAQYQVNVEAGADVTTYVTAKTASGFTVNLTPRLATSSVSAGSFNVQITW